MSGMWTHPGTLAGEVVRLEPLSLDHLEGLWAASRDPRTWRWLSIRQPRTRSALRAWAEEAVAGPDFAFATIVRADAADQSWGNLPVPPDPVPLVRSADRRLGRRRQRARRERPAREAVAEPVRGAARAEPRRCRKKREHRDEGAEHRTEGLEAR